MRLIEWTSGVVTRTSALALAVLTTTALVTSNAPTRAQPSSQSGACSRLANLFVPAWAIGLPTSGAVVQSATFVTAEAPNNQNGEYCAVKGLIVPASADAPNMEFQVNLPTSWNSKALQLGGGGYDGTLVTGLGMAGLQPASIPTPLKAGYVTLGSDGGHKALRASTAPSA